MTSLSTLTTAGTDAADANPFAVLPRNVWRHLVSSAGLGLRSQVVVAGDASELSASFFRSLGFDAVSAEDPTGDALTEVDAVIWLEIRPMSERTRSLLASESLQQTTQLLRRVGPRGVFQFVCLISNDGSAHEVECVESHLAAVGERPQMTIFPARSFAGFVLGAGRTFAVATCRADQRNQTTSPPSFDSVDHHDDSCCRGADRSRAA